MNNLRQLPPQFNNKYINNKLVNGYQKHVTTNIPFNNNSMLSNNPQYYGSIQNPDFYDRVNMAKRESMKKYKSVSDLKLSKDQLVKYIINPIKIDKLNENDKKEYINLLNDRSNTYIKKGEIDLKKITNYMQQLYAGRKNTPYKNILKKDLIKKDLYNQEYTKIDDLIVHKVTQFDKNKIRLLNELESLINKMEIHDNELKIIYSVSEKANHKKQFDYVKKYKNRIKYDPKNYNELKVKYKKEQTKLNKEGKRIDEMIELLLASEQLSSEDISELQKVTNITDNIDTHMDDVFDKGEKYLEKELEKQILKEVGKNGLKEIKKQLANSDSYSETDSDFETDSETDNKSEKNVQSKIILTSKVINKEKLLEPTSNVIKRKLQITKKIEKVENKIGHIDDDELNEYKNRNKN